MSPQGFRLRPIRLTDLPALKRWRSLPDIQRHLRHPQTSWWGHLCWWWSLRSDTTKRVWAVTEYGRLVGQAGWYYRKDVIAEASILVVRNGAEDYAAERDLMPLLDAEAERAGLLYLYAEVLATAPLQRHGIFVGWGVTAADTKSTIYKRIIA